MDFLKAIASSFVAATLCMAATMSHAEETIGIPESLRFFTVGADRETTFAEAFMFCIAAFHGLVTLPLIDKYLAKKAARPWKYDVRECVLNYLSVLAASWVVTLHVRDTEEI